MRTAHLPQVWPLLRMEHGEVHHVKPRGRADLDDLDNLQWRCGRFVGSCHTSEHPTGPFGECRKEAIKQFEAQEKKDEHNSTETEV